MQTVNLLGVTILVLGLNLYRSVSRSRQVREEAHASAGARHKARRALPLPRYARYQCTAKFGLV